MKLGKKGKLVLIISVAVALLAALAVIFALIFSDKGTPPERTKYIHGDFEYVILDDGTLEITSYLGSETSVRVDTAIGGRSVSSIGDSAFAGQSSIISLELGSFVKRIGAHAFN